MRITGSLIDRYEIKPRSESSLNTDIFSRNTSSYLVEHFAMLSKLFSER